MILLHVIFEAAPYCKNVSVEQLSSLMLLKQNPAWKLELIGLEPCYGW
jgi:hypothetical protein